MTIGLADVPPQILVTSFLKAMQKIGCDAVVICALQPKGPLATAMSNNGPAAVAAAAQALTVKEGAVDKAAEAIHDMRAKMPEGVSLTPEEIDAFGKCLVCSKSEKFAELDDDTKQFHRAIVECALAAVHMHTATASVQEPSRIVRV